jgi:hypothetical protein
MSAGQEADVSWSKIGARSAAVALAVVAAVIVALPAGVPVPAGPAATSWENARLTAATAQAPRPRTVRVASALVGDTFDVALTAEQGPDRGGAPTATVFLEVHQREGAAWRLLGRRRVGPVNGFFLGNLVGPESVCLFSLRGRPTLEIGLRFLIGQSAGCDPATIYFHLEGGRLVAGRARG